MDYIFSGITIIGGIVQLSTVGFGPKSIRLFLHIITGRRKGGTSNPY